MAILRAYRETMWISRNDMRAVGLRQPLADAWADEDEHGRRLTAEQRRVDALLDLFRRVRDQQSLPALRGRRTDLDRVTLVLHADTLLRCDLDHDTPWPRGPTAVDNLQPRCPRHHEQKTRRLVRTRLHPGGTVDHQVLCGPTVRTAPELLPGHGPGEGYARADEGYVRARGGEATPCPAPRSVGSRPPVGPYPLGPRCRTSRRKPSGPGGRSG